MKKSLILALALVLSLSLLLFGCSGKADEPSSVESTPAQESSLDGTVQDATMNTVTVQRADGTVYSFATEGAEVESPEGLLIGDVVTIYFTGTLDDSQQVQEVVVTRIVVDSQPAADDAQPESTPASVPAEVPAEDVKSIQGVIDQYDGSTMMVADATGVDYLFSLDGADLHVGEEGFAEGDNVIVYYYGDLVEGPDLQTVQVGEVKKADQ